jgi:hypothetical protein
MNERIKQLALQAFQPINDITSEGVGRIAKYFGLE